MALNLKLTANVRPVCGVASASRWHGFLRYYKWFITFILTLDAASCDGQG